MNIHGCDCSIVIKTTSCEMNVPYSEETLREAYSLLQEEASIEGDGINKAIRKRGGVTGCGHPTGATGRDRAGRGPRRRADRPRPGRAGAPAGVVGGADQRAHQGPVGGPEHRSGTGQRRYRRVPRRRRPPR